MTKVFKMRERITGSKKQNQEAHAVLNKKGDLVVSNKEILKVSLEHCLNTFENKEPHEDAKMLVKVKEQAHEIRMKAECTDTFEIEKDDFNEVLERFKRKNKKSYDLLTLSSNSFKNSVFKLFKRMIEEENFLNRFDETILHQLWKKKGIKENLNNHRYIHIKDWLPRLCECLVVGKMKEDILKGGTSYQIGGIPGHCCEEHLMSVKSIMQRCISMSGGCIVQLVDIQKFFDSENLRGVMNSLSEVKVNMKAYRTW